MFRTVRSAVAALIVGFAAVAATGQKAHAQYGGGPPMDMSAIYNMNANFDRQFYAALPGLCYQAAVATRGQQLPFNAMTISASTRDLQNTYAGYNAQWAQNSAAQSAAVGRWTTGAIQGNWGYSNGYGQNVILPYQYNSYYNQNGTMYGGYQYGGNNYYVNNSWGR